jgi:hypothetical protein
MYVYVSVCLFDCSRVCARVYACVWVVIGNMDTQVPDRDHHRILTFAMDGTLLATWTQGLFVDGEEGEGQSFRLSVTQSVCLSVSVYLSFFFLSFLFLVSLSLSLALCLSVFLFVWLFCVNFHSGIDCV